VEALRDSAPDVVAVDGKTSRRTHARAPLSFGGREPLHLVSAWASRQRLVLGQQAVSGKSNEITAIPLLLERLELTGALVTIDAIGCQTAIARAIRAKEADYLLAIKTNWPCLHAEIERYFDDTPATELDTLTTTCGDHGRIEIRRHAVSHDIAPRGSADPRCFAGGSSRLLADDGSAAIAVSRASRASRGLPASRWSRPRSSATAARPRRSATISAPRRWTLPPSPTRCAPIGAHRGASRAACTG
jgi:predicted transposase YbfD/YdcC